MTRLLLVRHGQSVWNAEGRWQGQADPPLSDLGERQAEAAVAAIGPVEAVVTSDLVRASRTAEILGAALSLPVEVEPGFRERDAGEWSGLTRAEIEEAWPGYLTDHRRPPGYELDEPLVERVLEAIERTSLSHPRRSVLVVTHGGVIRSLERHLGDDNPPVPNLGGRWVERAGADVRLGDRVLLIDPDDVAVTVPGQI